MVANPERGEVGVTVQRGDQTVEYVLKLTMNAAVAMQKRLGKPMVEVVADLQKVDFNTMRELVFMLLQKYHAKEINTIEKAGDLIDDAGGMGPFVVAFNTLMRVNAAQDDGANPPQAQEKTTQDASTSASAVLA